MLAHAALHALMFAIFPPAPAGDRDVSPAAAPRIDAMSLLLADERATFGTATKRNVAPIPLAPRFDVRAPTPVSVALGDPRALATFDRMPRSDFRAIPVSAESGASGAAPGFDLALSVDAPPDRWSLSGSPVEPIPVAALRASAARFDTGLLQPVRRRPRALDTMLVFHIDGESESPTIRLKGGVAGALWGALPRE